MKKEKFEITCKCGHEAKFHKTVGAPIHEDWCEAKGLPKDVGFNGVCACFEYRPDNLAHIERIAKKKGLVK